MLQIGSRGSAVEALQRKLGITADGIFGNQTASALKAWQAKHGLSSDGVYGPKSQAAMGGGGTAGHAAATGTSAAMTQYAQDYGYQLAFLKSDPELYKAFQTSVAGKEDAARFVARVKATGWYKTHGEAYRQNLALKTTDPATWAEKVASTSATIGDTASTMGAALSNRQLNDIANQATMFGWNDAQIRNNLTSYVKANSTTGDAGTIAQQLKATAYRNGVNVSDGYINSWQKKIAAGADNIDNAKQAIRTTFAKTLAPGYAKELDSGVDLYDIATPYMQSMAKTLELDPSNVDLFDPTIRKALAAPAAKNGEASTVPLWEFEQGLRQDPRFMKTQQAQDSAMAMGHNILQQFGLLS